jgi:enterochelin esterase-like enzyme
VWLEGLGDWSWPGRGGAAAEALPPAWVPAFPPQPSLAVPQPVSAPAPRWQSQRAIQRRLGAGALVSGLAAISAAAALNGPLSLERLVGLRSAASVGRASIASALAAPARPVPTLAPLSHGAAGSWVMSTSYASAALHRRGSFLVYLPPGYATTLRYPVLYLLTGNSQSVSAFLQIGLQQTLDELIARKAIPPLIAVMIQGGPGANNWHNEGPRGYQTYVVEVQELIDRMLPTIANRSARAIAGDSMGGYGAMRVALANPYRFSVVESWLGFFDGLEGQLRADRPVYSRLGLHAFVYGGESDVIANPDEDAPFAARLRAAGASAESAVYPGAHTLETFQANLAHMLTFAGRAVSASPGWRAALTSSGTDGVADIPATTAATDARPGAPDGGP